jgi:uncharacterized membrane protein YccC
VLPPPAPPSVAGLWRRGGTAGAAAATTLTTGQFDRRSGDRYRPRRRRLRAQRVGLVAGKAVTRLTRQKSVYRVVRDGVDDVALALDEVGVPSAFMPG